MGDITQKEAKEKLEALFSTWSSKKIIEPTIPTDLAPKNGLILLDMPGSEQTTIRVFSTAFAKDAPEEYAAGLAEIIMGGSFTSRLNSVLRTEKGYTYGASAGFAEEKYQNYLVVRTNVKTSKTVVALKDLYQILDSAKSGFSAEEIQKAKANSRSSIIELSTDRKSLASQNIYAMLNGENPSFLRTDLERNAEVSAEEMMTTAKYFEPQNGITLLIGDISKYEAELTEAGFEYQKVTLPE